MKMSAKRMGLVVAGLLVASSALAADQAVEARETVMKTMGQQLGTLGRMAKGEMDYDAATAQAAAAALLEAAQTDPATLWVEGTDNMTVEETRALPDIWDNPEDFEARRATLVEAAMQMNEAAGSSLQEMQAAMGGLGGACGGCHQAYRAPEN